MGEIAAAYVAGIFTVDEAISCAHSLGLAMLDMPGSKGVMLHTELQRKSLHTMEDSTLGFFILIFTSLKRFLLLRRLPGASLGSFVAVLVAPSCFQCILGPK